MTNKDCVREKPVYLQAVYTIVKEFEVKHVEDTLGISWDDVDRYYIKYAILHIHTKDGKDLTYDEGAPEVDSHDFKRPSETNSLDEDRNEIKAWSKAEIKAWSKAFRAD